jgi:hypothetical protein
MGDHHQPEPYEYPPFNPEESKPKEQLAVYLMLVSLLTMILSIVLLRGGH